MAEVCMIPMARDMVPLKVYKRTVTEGDGDVIEEWVKTNATVFVVAYPIASSRVQADSGQYTDDQYRLMFSAPKGVEVRTGDRLGDNVGTVWHLNEVRQSNGSSHLSCIGRRL